MAIGAVFLIFAKDYGQQKVNLGRLDFWGAVMLANIAVILAVIVAFWVQVNLIDTLWTLLFLIPITLFTFNKGLGGAASCKIEEQRT